eukprot:COSAG01_NODE_20575_length_947_cov_1.542453_2_plen_161_part_00
MWRLFLSRNIETQRTRVDLEQLRRYHDHGVIVIVLHSKYSEQENCDARGLRLLVLPCPPLASGCYRRSFRTDTAVRTAAAACVSVFQQRSHPWVRRDSFLLKYFAALPTDLLLFMIYQSYMCACMPRHRYLLRSRKVIVVCLEYLATRHTTRGIGRPALV